MHRSLLLLLLLPCCVWLRAAGVTFTVDSRTSVKSEGEMPMGAYAEYTQGGSRKCQLTKGSSAVLSLYGFGGYAIESVSLMMRSNQSAGAGSLSMTIADREVWTIENAPFSSNLWHGEWSGNYVPVEYMFRPRQPVGDSEAIVITIEATENSLYIESYTINYVELTTDCYTVGFDTHTSLSLPQERESVPAGGVVLPKADDQADAWFFIGWTEQPVESTTELPDYYKAGDTYYPEHNTVLHALYSNLQSADQKQYITQTEQLTDGIYLIGGTRFDGLMSGSSSTQNISLYSISTTRQEPESGLFMLEAGDYPAECYYMLQFSVQGTDSLAYIYNIADDNYVSPPAEGYATFNKSGNPWRFRELHDHTVLFYQQYSDYTRVINTTFVQSGQDYIDCFRAEKFRLDSFKDKGLSLFPDNTVLVEQTYTSYPVAEATESVRENGVVFSNGIVLNPQALELSVYDLSGRLLLTTCNTRFCLINKGIYIIASPEGKAMKVCF